MSQQQFLRIQPQWQLLFFSSVIYLFSFFLLSPEIGQPLYVTDVVVHQFSFMALFQGDQILTHAVVLITAGFLIDMLGVKKLMPVAIALMLLGLLVIGNLTSTDNLQLLNVTFDQLGMVRWAYSCFTASHDILLLCLLKLTATTLDKKHYPVYLLELLCAIILVQLVGPKFLELIFVAINNRVVFYLFVIFVLLIGGYQTILLLKDPRVRTACIALGDLLRLFYPRRLACALVIIASSVMFLVFQAKAWNITGPTDPVMIFSPVIWFLLGAFIGPLLTCLWLRQQSRQRLTLLVTYIISYACLSYLTHHLYQDSVIVFALMFVGGLCLTASLFIALLYLLEEFSPFSLAVAIAVILYLVIHLGHYWVELGDITQHVGWRQALNLHLPNHWYLGAAIILGIAAFGIILLQHKSEQPLPHSTLKQVCSDYWQGRRPLYKAFWVVYTLLPYTLPWLTFSLLWLTKGLWPNAMDESNFFQADDGTLITIMHVFMVMFVPYMIFATISAWRCGANSKVWWRYLSRIVIVIYSVYLLFALGHNLLG
ncbi:MAG: hypothetical protein CMF50_04650 [Legionellales bacterium]|nr:hypothetical protein [Legionellales bacterium]|tara:strand:+ start:10579 stop:12198 length:1620 start_codon:yes stop_codon:yes gene_type:complete